MEVFFSLLHNPRNASKTTDPQVMAGAMEPRGTERAAAGSVKSSKLCFMRELDARLRRPESYVIGHAAGGVNLPPAHLHPSLKTLLVEGSRTGLPRHLVPHAHLDDEPAWQLFRNYQECPPTASDEQVQNVLSNEAIPQCSRFPARKSFFSTLCPNQRVTELNPSVLGAHRF